jgi:hypothetical protein
MSRSLRICLSAFVALAVLTFQAAWVAQAHDGPARLELNAEWLNPGAPLEVRGINIAPELPISLALVGGGTEFSLGQVLGDPHGDFTLAIEVPREATGGNYTVRAFGTNRVVVTAQLVIAGAPVAAEGEGGQRDESEPLLAPMPRPQPAPLLPAAASSLPEAPAPAAPQLGGLALWALAGVALAVAAIGLAVMIRRRAFSARETLR